MKLPDIGQSFTRFCQVMATLRSPQGCPWDEAQTPESLCPYIIEEAYEVVDAIESKNNEKVCEELGDLLLQVVFQAQIFAEQKIFDIQDVVEGIREKLVRRHPHVFAAQTFADELDLHRQWERIKRDESRAKGEPEGILAGVPRTLPALLRAQKILSKGERNGLAIEQALGSLPVEDTSDREFALQIFALVREAQRRNIDVESALRRLCNDVQSCLEDPVQPSKTASPEENSGPDGQDIL